MSKKWDKYKQVRLTPENVQALNEVIKEQVFRISMAELVNAILHWEWSGKIPKKP